MKTKKKHYAIQYKERIWFLEKMIKKYYMANYKAKESVGINPGICCVTTLEGHEERLTISDADTMKSIIDDLPLWDCEVG
jgi:hypothetical protein